jgi:hypothetical protein
VLATSEAGLAAEGIDPEALLRQLELHVAHPKLRVSTQLAVELGLRAVDASLLSEAQNESVRTERPPLMKCYQKTKLPCHQACSL